MRTFALAIVTASIFSANWMILVAAVGLVNIASTHKSRQSDRVENIGSGSVTPEERNLQAKPLLPARQYDVRKLKNHPPMKNAKQNKTRARQPAPRMYWDRDKEARP